mmetsp:Transcript_8150/g.15342  ORF Transcript_8150/g.15342 Transcript_8150/m.15342 type:complete len:219 (-) Transcript_8150:20-676(-)
MIIDQLGYLPTNLVAVSARRGTGSPLALMTYSLNGGGARRKRKAVGELTPFPTLYWFCCPVVGKAISELERDGFVGILESRLSENSALLDDFIECHRGYARERWNLLLPEHQDYLLQSERMTGMVRDSGIAGTNYQSFYNPPLEASATTTIITTQSTRNSDVESSPTGPNKASIKCLHAHYAHYRSQIERPVECDYPLNIIGLWIDELLKDRYKDLIL